MKFRQIEVFNAIVLSGSISEAARSLGVSQPTVSKVLRRFEDQLGFSLFDRVAGRLQPTPRAETLFEATSSTLDHLSDLQALAQRLTDQGAGHLRFAMVPALGLEVAPRAMARFCDSEPSVTLEAQTLHEDQIARRLMRGDIDIGLVFNSPSRPRLKKRQITTTRYVCIAPIADNPLASGPVSLTELDGLQRIDLSLRSVLGRQLGSGRVGLESPARLVVDTYHLAKSLVSCGSGVAVVDGVTARSGDMAGLSLHDIPELEPIAIDLVYATKGLDLALVDQLGRLIAAELEALFADT